MNTCSRCTHFTMKGQSAEHKAVGLYRCPRRPAWEFRSATKPHDCARFSPVGDDALPARIAFERKESTTC